MPRPPRAGVGSALSVGLPILENVTGAVNIYGPPRRARSTTTRSCSPRRFAGYAAVALANAHLHHSTANLAQHMQAAMESRAVIEQAKGIIMGERRCTADEAFAVLTRSPRTPTASCARSPRPWWPGSRAARPRDGPQAVRVAGASSKVDLMGVRTWIEGWPVYRQLTGTDPLGRGAAAQSDRVRARSPPRTETADSVARSVCPYCAVGCGQRVFVKDGKVTQIEGDPDSPISRGRLCPKGSASKSLVTSDRRQQQGAATAGRTAPSGKSSTSTPRWR